MRGIVKSGISLQPGPPVLEVVADVRRQRYSLGVKRKLEELAFVGHQAVAEGEVGRLKRGFLSRKTCRVSCKCMKMNTGELTPRKCACASLSHHGSRPLHNPRTHVPCTTTTVISTNQLTCKQRRSTCGVDVLQARALLLVSIAVLVLPWGRAVARERKGKERVSAFDNRLRPEGQCFLYDVQGGAIEEATRALFDCRHSLLTVHALVFPGAVVRPAAVGALHRAVRHATEMAELSDRRST